MTNKSTINSLQAIRAFAAIFVLLFHVAGTFKSRFDYPIMSDIFGFGFSGVDLFFVLSGFIIYYTNSNKINYETTKDFLVKRFIRIFPIYWIALILTLSLYVAGKYFFPYTVTGASDTIKYIDAGGISSIIKSFFLIPSDYRTIYLAWTLSFEMVFYIIFGLCFFRNARFFNIILIIWIVLCCINTIFLKIDYMRNLNSNPFKAFLDPIIIEFFLGCIVAIFSLKYSKKYATPILILGGAFFMLSALFEREVFGFNHQLTFLYFGIPSAMIIYGAANINFEVPKILIELGNASYVIYLFHEQIFSIMLKLIPIFKLNTYSNSLLFLLSCLIILAICYVIHYCVEKPILIFLLAQVKIKDKT